MRLSQLPKITNKAKKRRGRGAGSGKGKTAGRGEKGQKKRSRVQPAFEGGQLRLVKRLPLARGRGFKSRNLPALVINLSDLNVFKDGAEVSHQTLSKVGLTERNEPQPVKILKKGHLQKKLILKGLAVSAATRQEIEKLGGKVLGD